MGQLPFKNNPPNEPLTLGRIIFFFVILRRGERIAYRDVQ